MTGTRGATAPTGLVRAPTALAGVPRAAEARAAARLLVERASRAPEQVFADATGLLHRLDAVAADGGGGLREWSEAAVLTRQASALAQIELGRGELALPRLHQAIHLAAAAGRPDLVAGCRLTLAWIELDRGAVAESLRQLDLAEPGLAGRELARSRCLRGLALCEAGRLDRALPELSSAVRALRRHADPHWLANALIGRGVGRAYARRLAAAEADLRTARRLLLRLGETGRAAMCLHNIGFVAGLAGRLPTALALYERAAREGVCPTRRPEALVDWAEALLAAGLLTEARSVLGHAVSQLRAAARHTRLAEALLMLGRCALHQGDVDTAARASAVAVSLLRQHHRANWVPLAVALRVRARLAGGETSAGVLRLARHAAAACDRSGWPVAAAELRLAAARVAAQQGAAGLAGDLLGLVAGHRDSGLAQLRAMAWLASALLATARGDRRAALAACRAGLVLVARQRAALGSSELRVSVNWPVAQLARLGMAHALATGRARTVLAWAEQCRDSLLTRPAVLPPRDPELADALVRLRLAVRRGAAEEERAVRRLAVAAPAGPAADQPLRPAELFAELGDAVFLDYLVHQGRLLVVVVADGRVRLRRLGPLAPVVAEIEALRFAMTVLAGQRTARAGRAVGHAAARLDDLLLRPVRSLLGDRSLVVLPAGALHALPWSVLPSCSGRPVSVAPSARCWLRARRAARSAAASGALWAAGPGLPGAEREVGALRRQHGGVLLVGSAATTGAVLAGMANRAVVHLAAHGRFRGDQPLFSHLCLADGPLYGYDLERLARPPKLVVLSGCDTGLVGGWGGGPEPGTGGGPGGADQPDELCGLASVLLRQGVSTLVASLLPVPDDRATDVMLALHRGLRAGLAPAAALAEAQAAHGQLGFVCFGSG
ncbi:CHAT domain-containing protein [Goodfellowiella coeruleoviolacea]|uniref:CHAT domain-containing protein n=1 Tax=Goodfellowiella coeruleoviolacea TaxID=334858 RepID=A0AAE3GD33_9PSEU|nr:CHAT domain-containing protein [Goodfellowiella coeruleoviolacea]MCP2166052.1 CHAT domain-containing protein [Goodfellowiella coeruleoviolacea]